MPYLFIDLFYIGMPVVWTDGRTYGHVITKILGRVDNYYHARAWSLCITDLKIADSFF